MCQHERRVWYSVRIVDGAYGMLSEGGQILTRRTGQCGTMGVYLWFSRVPGFQGGQMNIGPSPAEMFCGWSLRDCSNECLDLS